MPKIFLVPYDEADWKYVEKLKAALFSTVNWSITRRTVSRAEAWDLVNSASALSEPAFKCCKTPLDRQTLVKLVDCKPFRMCFLRDLTEGNLRTQ